MKFRIFTTAIFFFILSCYVILISGCFDGNALGKEICENNSEIIACWGGEVVWNSALNRCTCACDEGKWGARCQYEDDQCSGEIAQRENGKTYCSCENLPPCQSRFIFLYRNKFCRCSSPFYDDDDDEFVNDKVVVGYDKYMSENEPDYFPLVVGNSWTYDLYDAEGAATGEMTMEIIDSFVYEGVIYYDLNSFLPDSAGQIQDVIGPVLFHSDTELNQVAFYFSETQNSPIGYHSFPDPGTYMINGEEVLIESIGQVTVPAGTFENCMSFTDPVSETSLIYAPDIGLIKVIGEGVDNMVLSNQEKGCTLVAGAMINHVTCGNANSGAISISTQGASGTVLYTWSGPTNIGNIANPDNLSIGTYNVTISDESCQVIFEDITIENAASSPLSIDLINLMAVSCKYAEDGMILVEVSGGTPPYTLDWSNGRSDSYEINGLNEGNYDLTVTDANGCAAMESYDITIRQSQLPMTMSIQGLLTDTEDHVLANDQYDLTFQLYNVPTGGSPLWTENHFDIDVSSGIFSTILGIHTPLDLCFDEVYYLGISVETDPEMSPRIELTSSPYSVIAKSVEDDAITTHKIKDRSVTLEKIAPTILSGINGITNDGGEITLLPGSNIVISPDPSDHSITISSVDNGGSSSVSVEDLVPDVISSISGVSNDGGNVDIIAGQNIEVISNNNQNTITISANVPQAASQFWQEQNGGIAYDGNSVTLQKDENAPVARMIRLSDESGFIGSYGFNGNTNIKLSSLSSNSNKGFLTIDDESGDSKAGMYVGTSNTGVAFTDGANGNANIALSFLGGEPNHGFLAVKDADGTTQAGIYVDSDGNGRVFADQVDAIVDHPTKSNIQIRHSYLQGPEAGTYLRGTSRLENGRAAIDFPESFASIISDDRITVMITPLSAKSKGIAVIKKGSSGFRVQELLEGEGNYEFDWEVKGIRKGSENFKVLQLKLEEPLEKENH